MSDGLIVLRWAKRHYVPSDLPSEELLYHIRYSSSGSNVPIAPELLLSCQPIVCGSSLFSVDADEDRPIR